MAGSTGVAARITLEELTHDPYPAYRELRASDPVAWVPAANRYFVTRHEDVVAVQRDLELFSVLEQGGLAEGVMGLTMNRREGAEHLRQRKASGPPTRPGTVKRHWVPEFQRIADELVDGLVERGEADLFADFAGPFAALCLRAMLGLEGVDAARMQEWSAAMIAGAGNYAADPAVAARARTAADEVGDAVDDAVNRLSDTPNGTLVSAMLHAPDRLDVETIKSNVRLYVSGGLNEPRDVVATATFALLRHPDLLARVRTDPELHVAAFEESLRWMSPVGMLTRQTTADTDLGGVALAAGSRLGLMLASANRDERAFANPERFDLDRTAGAHVAFNGGAHFCQGSWIARAQVGMVALPTLFSRLPDLDLVDGDAVEFRGWVFRNVVALPVHWRA